MSKARKQKLSWLDENACHVARRDDYYYYNKTTIGKNTKEMWWLRYPTFIHTSYTNIYK